MSPGSEELERLISRHLDGECTPAEAEYLRDLLANDRVARARYHAARELDALARVAMRTALGRPAGVAGAARFRSRGLRGAALAAAAVLAALVWLHPPQGPVSSGDRSVATAAAPSWFAPAPATPDIIESIPVSYERPALRVQGTQQNWIIVPGRDAGTYLVIEVEQVRTHIIGVHRDF